MEIEMIGDLGTEWTDTPRDLNMGEAYDIVHLTRLEGVKLHRELTHSTLTAAVREVDKLRRIAGA